MTEYEVVRDPLWDNIRIDAAALDVLDTPAMQRLRYVRKLGHAFLVYPGATHTRFEHALGAYHLTRRALANLSERGELAQLDESQRMARLDLGQEKRGCRLGTNERLSGGDRVPLPTELEFKHCPIPVEKRGL